MWNFVVSKVQEWVTAAREIYSVDPVIFVVLIVAMAPFFYYSIFRLVRALARKNSGEIPLWSAVFLAATAIPYLYVLIFGRNFPWWLYIVLGLLLAQGVYSLVKKLRVKPAGEDGKNPPKP
jgi:hypothetical protein